MLFAIIKIQDAIDILKGRSGREISQAIQELESALKKIKDVHYGAGRAVASQQSRICSICQDNPCCCLA